MEILIPKKGANKITVHKCRSAADVLAAPEEFLRVPHIAVVGRANVGKSSLINHVLQQKALVKTSSAAGKTNSVDMLLVNDKFVLTDLPGYPNMTSSTGRQVAGDKRWHGEWENMVHSYLELGAQGKIDFRALLLLFNIEKKVSPTDLEFLEDLGYHSFPQLLVMTKDDKMKGHEERNKRAEGLRKRLKWEGPHIHYRTDSENPLSRKSRRHLQRFIRSFVTADDVEGARAAIAAAWQSRVSKSKAESLESPPSSEDSTPHDQDKRNSVSEA
ncbi:hypothetical protein CYMTET_43444 [Cymbomonas tetramitiformis]|uniref:EngB-type G domain-containing protein n=1 Tax=Cymbomonas tetramitiformis TaxID=36881 RepID=A0AAE0C280_9CHLO|nr:hypothetical protein CYMTET_43444 [Cymbomonas tetramitiformis]